jgi:hypothetical protein
MTGQKPKVCPAMSSVVTVQDGYGRPVPEWFPAYCVGTDCAWWTENDGGRCSVQEGPPIRVDIHHGGLKA